MPEEITLSGRESGGRREGSHICVRVSPSSGETGSGEKRGDRAEVEKRNPNKRIPKKKGIDREDQPLNRATERKTIIWYKRPKGLTFEGGKEQQRWASLKRSYRETDSEIFVSELIS